MDIGIEKYAEKYDEGVNVFSGYKSKINGLCDRAALCLLSALSEEIRLADTFFNEEQTAIEQIFSIAFMFLACKVKGTVEYPKEAGADKVSLREELLCLSSQEEIDCFNHSYIADFLFSSFTLHDCKGIVFEMDGYGYHSTKQQMNKDYERERNLQKAGYKVIRFTGSQIYKRPFSCAKEAIEIILNSMDGVEF